jgi:hypothetical protein
MEISCPICKSFGYGIEDMVHTCCGIRMVTGWSDKERERWNLIIEESRLETEESWKSFTPEEETKFLHLLDKRVLVDEP